MFDQGVSIILSTPGVDELSDAIGAVREWQQGGASVQLHPGDLGWNWRLGAEATAAAVRTWSRDGHILSVGMLDSPALLRLAIAPSAQDDEDLAEQILADVSRPERGVLPRGEIRIEVRCGDVLRGTLFDHGWQDAAPWTPLERDLAEPVEDCGVRIEVVRTTTGILLCQRRGCGRRVRGGPGCSNRWASTASIAVTATAGPSPWPPRQRSGSWVRRPRPCAPAAPTPAVSPPTCRPASRRSRKCGTCAEALSSAPGRRADSASPSSPHRPPGESPRHAETPRNGAAFGFVGPVVLA